MPGAMARLRRAIWAIFMWGKYAHTHYGFRSLALANPTLDERAIPQRLWSEYTLRTGAADFVEVPSGLV